MTSYRDTVVGELRPEHAGNAVWLAGWVDGRRDHGGVVFVDLRDHTGLVQVVLNPDDIEVPTDVIHGLRSEYCISVRGLVRERTAENVNPDLPTGGIEVGVTDLEVLSAAQALPFQLDDRATVDESRRLQYRYLDLRTSRMAANLLGRSKAIASMRRTMDGLGFQEIETPTLIASTPEGARDLLVPSRLRPGNFYALPQSPQLFKQLLMIAGVHRYYQVARCYRDEDFRADRQVEFTQLDFEGSFWDQEDVLQTLEEIMVNVVREVRGVELPRPFPRMTYAEAIDRYGVDKPDIRFGMQITDLGGVFANTEFKAFSGAIESGGVVRGINSGAREMSRAGFDTLTAKAQELGAKGLVWMVVQDDGTLRSPVAKFLTDEEQAALMTELGAVPGDVLFIVADSRKTASHVLGQLRLELGRIEGHDELAPLFVVDFPVFERTEGGGLAALHHPFTAPVDVDEMRNDPDNAISKAYDLVLNGAELGSGSVRIHSPEVQQSVFDILGITPEEAASRFGWFLEALRYGTPPHAGFAIGIDRLVSIMQGEPNIREVMPFPKTQTGADPLTGSPSRVAEVQLKELGVEVAREVRAEWESE